MCFLFPHQMIDCIEHGTPPTSEQTNIVAEHILRDWQLAGCAGGEVARDRRRWTNVLRLAQIALTGRPALVARGGRPRRNGG